VLALNSHSAGYFTCRAVCN